MSLAVTRASGRPACDGQGSGSGSGADVQGGVGRGAPRVNGVEQTDEPVAVGAKEDGITGAAAGGVQMQSPVQHADPDGGPEQAVLGVENAPDLHRIEQGGLQVGRREGPAPAEDIPEVAGPCAVQSCGHAAMRGRRRRHEMVAGVVEPVQQIDQGGARFGRRGVGRLDQADLSWFCGPQSALR
jgi:hypothetical protein